MKKVNRRTVIKRLGMGTVALAASSHYGQVFAQSNRYAKYRGSTVLVHIPEHPHYNAARQLFAEFTAETGIRVE